MQERKFESEDFEKFCVEQLDLKLEPWQRECVFYYLKAKFDPTVVVRPRKTGLSSRIGEYTGKTMRSI